MLTIGFWNIDKRVAADMLARFAHEFQIDVLVLAECHHSSSTIVKNLGAVCKRAYFPDAVPIDRLAIFTSFHAAKSSLIRDSMELSIRHYKLPLGPSVLIVAAHVASKLWRNEADHVQICTRIARHVKDAEAKVGHSRTVLIGDLNMNPFEAGMVGSEGLHAVMDRRVAASRKRKVMGEDSIFFYNPMWSMFGHGSPRPGGTYFYSSSTEVNFYWNLFDQVLIRPDLLDCVDDSGVEIVTTVDGLSLLTNKGRPNRAMMSDHLPVVCRINELQLLEV